MIKLACPRQDPGSTVLNMLKLLKTSARDPDEERITVVQPGGDKGVDQLLSIAEGKGGAEFSNVSQMKVSSFGEMLDM